MYWLRDHQLAAMNLPSGATPSHIRFHSSEITISDFCASFEQAIVDTLVSKTLKAAKLFSPKSVVLAGGVSANKKLRSTLEQSIKQHFPKTSFLMAAPQYCMDNGAMIAAAGYYLARDKKFTPWDTFGVNPNWKVGPIIRPT